MKNTITKETLGLMTGAVFFGTATVVLDHPNKIHSFTVCAHLEVGRMYQCRAITKVKAGWNTIVDFDSKAEHMWSRVNKTTQTIQVNINGLWLSIYTTKGGLWATVDKVMLDLCTVGDIRTSAPKMGCNHTWTKNNAKTWADLAFVSNK